MTHSIYRIYWTPKAEFNEHLSKVSALDMEDHGTFEAASSSEALDMYITSEGFDSLDEYWEARSGYVFCIEIGPVRIPAQRGLAKQSKKRKITPNEKD